MPIITVVVLGDVGRSPRMQYQALSLCQLGEVRLVGLEGEPCIREVEESCQQVHALGDVKLLQTLVPVYALRAPLRALALSSKLLFALLWEPSDLYVVQNPPAVPTLVVVGLAAWWQGSAVVIDWHNLGFRMFAPSGGGDDHHSSRGVRRVFAAATRLVERLAGVYLADLNLTVTGALKAWLEREFALDASRVCVLHDRPFERFSLAAAASDSTDDQQQRQRVFDSLNSSLTYEDVFVHRNTILAVTSTSWTEDEDFDMLLDACRAYTGRARLHVVITGKGPLLTKYLPLLASFPNKLCTLQSVWFSQQDYPRFLQLCQLGICMHTSTSGLDLPMKVIDMFGSGLPVLAKRFECIEELVLPGKNGLLFASAQELAAQLTSVGNADDNLEAMREYIASNPLLGWQQHWNATVKHEMEKLLLLVDGSNTIRRRRRRRRKRLGLVVVVAVVTVLVLVVAAVLAAGGE